MYYTNDRDSHFSDEKNCPGGLSWKYGQGSGLPWEKKKNRSKHVREEIS